MNKQNLNAPQVTFRRINGRIIPIVNGKQPRGATGPLRQELKDREEEILHAEQGMRGVGYYEGHAVKNFGTKSTFPQWYSQIGFKNKADFRSTVKSKKGVKYDRLVKDSIDSLLHGRSSSFGQVPANTKFRLATHQEYNNRGVIFRKINGQVVPLRPKHEEIPF